MKITKVVTSKKWCIVNHNLRVIFAGNRERCVHFLYKHNSIAPNMLGLSLMTVQEAVLKGLFSPPDEDWYEKLYKLSQLEEGGIQGLFADELADLQALNERLGLI